MKYLFVFSVKTERAPCLLWPLESVAIGFRPLWRMCDPPLPPTSPGNTQPGLTPSSGRCTRWFSHFIYLDSCLLILFHSFSSLSLNWYFQPASRKNISLKLSVLKPRLECLCVEILSLLKQWCNCSAMSAPACLWSSHMSCDWVMSPCQLYHCRSMRQQARIICPAPQSDANHHCNVTVSSGGFVNVYRTSSISAFQ